MQPHTHENLMKTALRPELVMARGAGSEIWDSEGRRYLDFVQGWAVNTLGHCAPELVAALSEQARELVSASPAYFNAPQLELASALTEATGMDQVYFSNSGAEANECAFKLARKWGSLYRKGAYGIVTTHHSFHGRTLACMAASGKPAFEKLFLPHPPGFSKVPFGDVDAMAHAIDDDTVAVLVEPIQGEAGVVLPPNDYLARLRALTEERGVLFILDEIQTGVGRTGTFLAAEPSGVRADIVTLGKGLGGGVPISATLARHEVCCFDPGEQGGTYHGNPLTAAVALAVVTLVRAPQFLSQVRTQSAFLAEVLEQLGATFGAERRGAGLLQALVLETPNARNVARAALEAGLLINAAQSDVLRFMPQLRVSHGDIEEMATILRRAWPQSG